MAFAPKTQVKGKRAKKLRISYGSIFQTTDN